MSLKSYENAAIFTYEGKMERAFAHSSSDFLKHADVVQEIMTKIMKYEEARDGRWIWKISDHWHSLTGWELEGGTYVKA